MRNDLDRSLHRSHIDPSKLSTFERILLTTDGTVTDMLEAYFFEQIQLVKLSEQLIHLDRELPEMDLSQGSEVIQRKILLQGKISRRNYIYADSILALERLDDRFRKELLETKTPIGKIWLQQKVETFKEILDTGKQPANGLCNYFNIAESDPVLFRTYCVRSNRKATMMITEKFPKIYFNKEI